MEHSNLRPFQKYKWPFEDLTLIAEAQLCKAIINLYNQTQDSADQEGGLRSKRFIITLLLKVASQIKWAQLNQEDPVFKQFMNILIEVTHKKKVQPDQSASKWEQELMESWERVVDFKI